MGNKLSMDEQLLPDLLRLRGSVVAASDEFFAAKENLIKPTPPVFVPETYDAKGQVYDGWETRRQRGSSVNCRPSGSNPCSCHSITSASASTTIIDRTPEFSSTADAV